MEDEYDGVCVFVGLSVLVCFISDDHRPRDPLVTPEALRAIDSVHVSASLRGWRFHPRPSGGR